MSDKWVSCAAFDEQREKLLRVCSDALDKEKHPEFFPGYFGKGLTACNLFVEWCVRVMGYDTKVLLSHWVDKKKNIDKWIPANANQMYVNLLNAGDKIAPQVTGADARRLAWCGVPVIAAAKKLDPRAGSGHISIIYPDPQDSPHTLRCNNVGGIVGVFETDSPEAFGKYDVSGGNQYGLSAIRFFILLTAV